MEFHLKIIGWLLIALALIHVVFPNYFDWKKELAKLSLVNREMMYVHTFFIAIVVLLMGILCVTSSRELMTTTLGQRIALGFGIFWFLRLLIQFFGYSSKLWQGNTFETCVHVVFTLLWTYFTIVFFIVSDFC